MSETLDVELAGRLKAVADIVRQEGLHDFPSSSAGSGYIRASFCGVTVFLEGGEPVRVQASDLDVVLDLDSGAAANDAPPTRGSRPPLRFRQGTPAALGLLHSRLLRLQNCFDPLQDGSMIAKSAA